LNNTNRVYYKHLLEDKNAFSWKVIKKIKDSHLPEKIASIIIPALNEAESIGYVISSIPMEWTCEIIVVDGGSSDDTVAIAEQIGAHVIHETRRGYSRACLSGLMYASGKVVVFLDADGADDPRHLPELLAPILNEQADLVLGSRLAGKIDKGAMQWTQWLGNFLAAAMFRLFYRLPITDLSPFRAGLRDKIITLNLQEMTYGAPTEMIAKAVRQGWKIKEIPVTYHARRGGKSKITGTWRGSILASSQIFILILRYLRS
jgi:glycosyltransferase involved in cell wall biosynthesis